MGQLDVTAKTNTQFVDVLYTDVAAGTPDTVLKTQDLGSEIGADQATTIALTGAEEPPGRRFATRNRNGTGSSTLSNIVEVPAGGGGGGAPPAPTGQNQKYGIDFTGRTTGLNVRDTNLEAFNGAPARNWEGGNFRDVDYVMSGAEPYVTAEDATGGAAFDFGALPKAVFVDWEPNTNTFLIRFNAAGGDTNTDDGCFVRLTGNESQSTDILIEDALGATQTVTTYPFTARQWVGVFITDNGNGTADISVETWDGSVWTQRAAMSAAAVDAGQHYVGVTMKTAAADKVFALNVYDTV